MNERLVSPPDAPPLVVKAQGTDQMLRAGSRYRVGRDPESDIVVSDSRVSWRHAVLRADGNCWLLEDSGSTNGTFLGARRVDRVEITQNCVLRLGHPDDGPVMMLAVARPGAAPVNTGRSSVDRRPTTVLPAPTRRLRIGRAPGNDLVVPDLSVSREHAELRNLGHGRYEIVDLDSHNGTFVNGRRVAQAATVTERDLIGIGPATFRLVGDELREFIDEGDVSLVAQDLTVRLSGGKVLLDRVSFPIGERSLVGIIGPSGAGKSTLLGALTGMRPATEGAVLYDNRDLYTHYAELRHRIGLVPQDNILHTQLSAQRALGYAAELRFPGDTSSGERRHRVTEVIGELGLTKHAKTRAGALSGGQQKRVNVALELLTKPSLLFLDEPTSGLDPGLDKSVMEMMSRLAKDGRTVIVVTHSVANLDICDRLLVLVPGGKVAFYGPPTDGLKHFQKPGWAEVFQAFEAEPDRDWAGDFRNSHYYTEYVAAGLPGSLPAQAQHRSAAPPPPPRSRGRLGQLSTLCRRYMAVIASDRNFLIMLAVLPIVLGGLILAMGRTAPQGLAGHDNGGVSSVLLTLVICACLAGTTNSVRELVKERAIYERERAAGLSSGAYLWSKLIVLGVITAVQAAVLVLIGLAGLKMPSQGSVLASSPRVEIILAVALLAVASMTLGLLVSAIVNTSEKTMPFLVLSVMAQVILSGGLLALPAGLAQISYLTPARWGFAATASTVDFNNIIPPGQFKPEWIWNHTPVSWLTDMAAQAVLALLFLAVAWWRLVRLSPGRKRR
ncbi:MAG TPA: FHA domain-containing protein [Streptosporangiaceae bacterium]|nr:FHA domain-containing protein [Streptosporangiaceae bacterium]